MDLFDIAVARTLSGGGGGTSNLGMMLVTYTIDWDVDEGEPPIVTCDKTLEQISSHIEAGGSVCATYGYNNIMSLKTYGRSSGTPFVGFYDVTVYDNGDSLEISYETILHRYAEDSEQMEYTGASGTVAKVG